MKKHSKVVTLGVLLVFVSFYFLMPFSSLSAAGDTYYVDQATGNDLEDGLSESTAFLTIQKAADTATAGDTVLIRNGTYRETVTPANSGTANNYITYKNYPGENPVVSGADVISGWSSLGSHESGGLFTSGAETGDTTEFTSVTVDAGNTVSAQNSIKNQGDYALRADFGGTNRNARGNKNFTLNDDVYGRMYFRLNSSFHMASSDQRVELLQLRDTSSINRARVGVAEDGSGNLYLIGRIETPATNTFYTGTPGEISRDTWHYIELRYRGNSVSGGAEVWLDGVSMGSNYAVDTTGLGVSRIEVGVSSSSQTAPTAGSALFIDDIKTDTSPIGAFSPSGSNNVYSRSTSWNAHQVIVDDDTNIDEETSVGALDEGEFYMDDPNDTLYVRLEGNANPNSHQVEVTRRQYIIHPVNVSYLRFENLTVQMVNTSSSGGFDFENVDNSIVINNKSISNFGKGVYLDNGSENNLISNNTFSDNRGKFGGGVRIEDDSNNNTIEYNDISGYDDLSDGSSGIQVRSSDNNILRYNSIHDAWDSGFYLTENTVGQDGSDNNQIYGNVINGINESQYAGHAGNGVHIAIDSDNNLVYNNVIGNVYGYGLQLRHNASNNKLYNNTIYNTGMGDNGDGIGLILGSTAGATGVSGNTMVNNIVHTSNNACFSIDVAAVSAGGNTQDYNLCYNPSGIIAEYNGSNYTNLSSYQSASGQDLHSKNSDPKFVNIAQDNFRITSSSPAYNSGTYLAEVTEDILKIARPQAGTQDMGAYEFEPSDDVPATSGSADGSSSDEETNFASYYGFQDKDESSNKQDPNNVSTPGSIWDGGSSASQEAVSNNSSNAGRMLIGVLVLLVVASPFVIAKLRKRRNQVAPNFNQYATPTIITPSRVEPNLGRKNHLHF